MVFPLLAVGFICLAGLVGSVFKQGQANPKADGFLDSKSSAFDRL